VWAEQEYYGKRDGGPRKNFQELEDQLCDFHRVSSESNVELRGAAGLYREASPGAAGLGRCVIARPRNKWDASFLFIEQRVASPLIRT